MNRENAKSSSWKQLWKKWHDCIMAQQWWSDMEINAGYEVILQTCPVAIPNALLFLPTSPLRQTRVSKLCRWHWHFTLFRDFACAIANELSPNTVQKKLHQPLNQRHKLKCLGASKALGLLTLLILGKLNYSQKWLIWVAEPARKGTREKDKTKGATALGKNRDTVRDKTPKPAQKCLLRAVFWIWTRLRKPSAITPLLPRAKGSTGRLQDSSAPSLPGPVPAEWEGLIQTHRKQPQRGKKLSLHVLVSSPASQAAACRKDLFMEQGRAEWNKPKRGLWRRNPSTRDYCSQGAEDPWSLHTENSSGVSSGLVLQEFLHYFQRSHIPALTSHQKAGQGHSKVEKLGDWTIPRYFCPSWGEKSPLPQWLCMTQQQCS